MANWMIPPVRSGAGPAIYWRGTSAARPPRGLRRSPPARAGATGKPNELLVPNESKSLFYLEPMSGFEPLTY